MVLGEFTLGIEEEYQIVDPSTRALKSAISQMMEAQTPLDAVELQGELHQSVVEVATGICDNVDDVRAAVTENRRAAEKIAERVGACIVAASTHPIARWQEQTISTDERYKTIVHDLQDVARANLIYGLHVHVGLPDREEAIAVFNQARYFLPHLLALSTSSPFFNGRKSGLKSTRTNIFKRLPRTGIPDTFPSYGELERFVQTLVKTGCIDDARRIWWDLRPHPKFSTLEFRICDLPTRVEDVVAIAGLVQAVVAKLTKLKRNNLSFALHPVAFIQENKWRAARYGVQSDLIDFGRQAPVGFGALVEELLEFVDDVLDELGARQIEATVRRIASEGTSADRQLEVYVRSNGRLEDVVDHLIAETMEGIETA